MRGGFAPHPTKGALPPWTPHQEATAPWTRDPFGRGPGARPLAGRGAAPRLSFFDQWAFFKHWSWALLLGHISLATAATNTFAPDDGLPPIVEDTTKAADCTVTYLVADTATNDLYAVRMRIAPGVDERPVNGVMPCPRAVPLRVATRALDVCVDRAADPKNCVFADMGRGFETQPTASNTAENTSSCASDAASDIGVACWPSGELQVCGVGCGASPAAAVAAAVKRCETRHQRSCPITGALPVPAPR